MTNMVEKMGIDVQVVSANAPLDPSLSQRVYEEGDYLWLRDVYGVLWRMPKQGGSYYDMAEHPFANTEDPREVERYQWPEMNDPGIYRDMKSAADQITYQRTRAYCLKSPYGGVWETALWLRGFESMFCKMMLQKGFVMR